jgi:acetyltransferase-like isoleucine patch superfamily enzyme
MLKYLLNYFLLNVASPAIPHPKLRAAYLRLLGASIGKNVRIEKVTFIQVQNSISNLRCGDNTFIGSCVILDLSAPITLDEYAAIAPGCTILTHQDLGEFNGNVLCTIYKTKVSGVHLNRNAVVGVDSTVLAGASLGRYSVVGAKSLVSADVPANVLVSGNPAKVVGKHGCLLPPEKEAK